MSYKFPILCSKCNVYKPIVKNDMIDGGWVFHMLDTHGIPKEMSVKWLNEQLTSIHNLLWEFKKKNGYIPVLQKDGTITNI